MYRVNAKEILSSVLCHSLYPVAFSIRQSRRKKLEKKKKKKKKKKNRNGATKYNYFVLSDFKREGGINFG